MANAEEQDGLSLEYFVLDVFSERRLEGNPVAVVLNPGYLTTELMQAIARETNLSETVFVERRDAQTERREGVRARIFTTQEELPFAGHPTLGMASLLRWLAPECAMDETVTLALDVGPIPVRFDKPSDGKRWPLRGEMTQRDPEFGEVLDKEEVAALTGLSVSDFDAERPIQIVSTGTAFAIVPLAALHPSQALARLNVRQQEASAYLRARGARWFYVLGPEELPHSLPDSVHDASRAPAGVDGSLSGAAPRWRARMQFNGGEDPATGSAAGCAIGYLVKWGLVAPDLTVHLRQGLEMKRPSDLFLTASLSNDGDGRQRITQVRVAGRTVLMAKGRLFLP